MFCGDMTTPKTTKLHGIVNSNLTKINGSISPQAKRPNLYKWLFIDNIITHYYRHFPNRPFSNKISSEKPCWLCMCMSMCIYVFNENKIYEIVYLYMLCNCMYIYNKVDPRDISQAKGKWNGKTMIAYFMDLLIFESSGVDAKLARNQIHTYIYIYDGVSEINVRTEQNIYRKS